MIVADAAQLAFVTLALLVGTVVLLAVGVYGVRWARSKMSDTTANQVFTLQDLREMRDNGQITEQEFETMRAAILGSALDNAPSREPERQPPETGA